MFNKPAVLPTIHRGIYVAVAAIHLRHAPGNVSRELCYRQILRSGVRKGFHSTCAGCLQTLDELQEIRRLSLCSVDVHCLLSQSKPNNPAGLVTNIRFRASESGTHVARRFKSSPVSLSPSGI